MSYEAWGEPEDSPFEAALEAGWIDPTDMSKAMLDVMNERDRQWNEEHFDLAHDDKHVGGELASAALCYVIHAVVYTQMQAAGIEQAKIDHASRTAPVPALWPWDRDWWKPKGQRRDLARAAALLVAEIERIDRAEAAK